MLDTKGVPIENIYILHYRHGMNPGCTKGFYYKGDLKSAIRRGREHCEIMGYHYIFVRPFIIDLDKEEKLHLDGNRGGEALVAVPNLKET